MSPSGSALDQARRIGAGCLALEQTILLGGCFTSEELQAALDTCAAAGQRLEKLLGAPVMLTLSERREEPSLFIRIAEED